MDAPPPRKTGSMGDSMRTIGALSTVGLAFVLAILIGVVCGNYLDKWLGTSPWFFLLFLVFGIAAGIMNVYKTAGRFLK
ncbi:MAG: AtpZ/AtpI family protein [Acidobacteriota bacterium]